MYVAVSKLRISLVYISDRAGEKGERERERERERGRERERERERVESRERM